MSRVDIIGNTFGNWKVLGPCEGRYVLCECQCKNKTTKMVSIYHLTSGRSKSCGHCDSIVYKIGDKVGHFTILKVLPDFKYLCQCDCEASTELLLTDRDLRRRKSCGCAHGNRGKHASNFIDMTGEKVNEWEFLEYVGNNKWLVKCSCNKEFIRDGQSIRDGLSKSCGHEYNKFRDITGQINDCFKATDYLGNKTWRCKCQVCGKQKDITRKIFQTTKLTCNHKNTDGTVRIKKINHKEYKGKTFGCWKVIEYIKGGLWECRCTVCNKTRVLSTYRLGTSSVKCNHIVINVGDVYNNWEVIKVIDDTYVECRCKCGCGGNTSIISVYDLINGKSKSCGFNTNKFKDLKGQLFGNWKVLEYECSGYWKCECQCNNKTLRYIHTYSLRSGNSKSCGCLKRQLNINSRLNNIGEISKCKVCKPREIWKVYTINDKDLLKDYIENSVCETVTELAESLGVTYSTLLQRIKKYDLVDIVHINRGKSLKEKQLREYIESIYSGNIVVGDRKTLCGRELDILIPDLKIAIEFNGTYWHSTEFKHKDYHKLKTIDCAKKGIQLIHIFEYEWDDCFIQNKIKNYLNTLINSNNRIYARNTKVMEISSDVASEFLDKHHLQNGNASSVVNIGCIYNGNLIGVMTFGRPRFNDNYDYEIIRFAWDNSVKVVGGASKMFRHFIDKYNPSSVLTYSDISKFTGNVYLSIGFRPCDIPFSEPGYVWVGSNNNIVLSRYQTQKHKLIEEWIGTKEQTEDEIMKSHNFLKIYDSGNLRLEWNG